MNRRVEADLQGRIVLVTGATSGMGREVARALSSLGAHVVLGCRDPSRTAATARDIGEVTGRVPDAFLPLDLSSMRSVRDFTAAFNARYGHLDILVNNAAASLATREVTADGFERHWATNVLGPHLLSRSLLPALRNSNAGRIVNVSTRAARGLDLRDTQFEHRPYTQIRAYLASKQAARMLTWSLADELATSPVTVNAVNPGYVLSPLTTNVSGWLRLLVTATSFRAKTPADGADTTIWAAASPAIEGQSARFWSNRREISCAFRDAALIRQLREMVETQIDAATRRMPMSPRPS